MATIETLDIQINVSTDKASKAINNLARGVRLLASAMDKFQAVKAENFTVIKNGIEQLGRTNTENLAKVGRTLKILSKGMSSFNAVSFSEDKSSSINNMASSLDKIASIPDIPIAKIKVLPQAAKNISKFCQEINKIGQVTFDSTKISEIISPLSGLNIEKLVPMTSKLPAIANNLSKFYSKISQAGTIDFNITKLVNLITKFETVSGNIPSIEKSASKLPSIGYNLSNFYSQIKKSGTISFDIAGLSKLIEGLEKVSGKISSVETAAAKLPIVGNNLSKFIREINKAGKVTFDITSLANLISGIGKLDSKTATTSTTNLPRVSKDLQKFIKGLNGLEKVTFDVAGLANLVKSISKLGGGSVSSAVENIPRITAALKGMMTQLSSAPRVSRNIIDMTNALADLIRQSRSASSASGRFDSSMNRTNSSISKSHKQFQNLTLNLKSLTQQLLAASGIYLSIYGAVRGFKNAVQSSMNYVEDLNYFNAAFGQVAESADLSSWKEAGYNSATAYYNSFVERAEQLTQKMTGYQVSQSGMLLSTGEKNLGINPSQLMNYQAVFGQMSSSMGTTSENALLLSDVLTKIGADLASVKNMDFDKVWNDMASGLAGMSRTLDKYGVNIRNVNLQQKLNELGIQANITKLNQNEKALLRTIILLDTTRYAWADMSDTINQPANQLRLLQANFSNLGRTIGNIFLPIVAKVLPYLNAVAIALQRLAEKIVLLLGFEDFDWGGLGKSGGTTSDALSTIYDETENVSDAMGDATKKAKEFQNQLLGFDEAYKLSEPAEDTSSSATGAGLSGPDTAALDAAFKKIASEYQAAWDKAFSEMEQKSTAIADRIISAFERGDYKGIGTYISTNISDALASINWDSVYQGAKNFGTGLAEFMNGLITPDLFGNVGKTIAGALNTKLYAVLSFGQTFDFTNLGESIAAGINNFFATFDFGGLAETLNVWAKGIFDTIITSISKINWEDIGKQIGIFLSKINIFDVGVKIVQTLYEGIKAGFVLFAGMFKKSPIETMIISLTIMPKLLKTIMASKFITGFKKLANGIKLVSGAVIGNQTAITALSSQYPKLSKVINVAKDSFRALRTGISNGSVFNGVKLAIENLRNNLTGLQKGAITAVAGFAEFNIVSDVFEGLISGSENLVAGLAKIGGIVSVAAAAMYTAFGPAGLAIAAVTGVVAAIKGISDAFNKIEAEEIGNVIKNALSNPGGTAISELAQGVSNAFSEATSGFKELNSASESVTSINKNIQSVVDEIGRIKSAMDLGVLSVDEGRQKLDGLFSELVDLTGQKMGALTTYLLGLYGEGGALSHAYEETEYSAQQVTDAIIRTQYATTDAAQTIYEQMKEVDFGSSEWNSLYQQLLNVSSGMDEIKTATLTFSDDMQKLEGSINWDEILLPDGSVNTDKLGQILGDVSASFEEYNNALNEEEKNAKLHWHEMLANAATPEDKALFQQLLDDVSDQFDVMRSEAETHITDFTNMLQTDFIVKTGDVIEGAQDEWNSKTDWAKFWAGAFGSKTESEYIYDAVNKQKENVQILSDVIQEEFEGLEASGVALGNDVAENVYSSLFDYENRWGAKGKYILKENYREILEEATRESPRIAVERGEEVSEGYAYGISNNLNVVNQAAVAMTNIAMDAIRQTQNSHSPSKVTEGFGKNAVEGYNLGISNNINSTRVNIQQWIDNIRQAMSNSNLLSLSQQNGLNVISGFNQGINGGASSTYDTINYYTERIKSGFSNISNSFYNIGESAMQGFSNGLSDKQQEIYNKAQTISKNLAQTIKSALSIHSPSKVMFELGDYTMQGFKNGLEHLYQPILSSVQGFSSDLQIAPVPDLKNIYGDYQYADMNYSMSYEGIEDYQSNYQNSNAETNALLRELLSAVREGKIIQVDGKQLGKTVQEQDKAHFNMTGRGLFIY